MQIVGYFNKELNIKVNIMKLPFEKIDDNKNIFLKSIKYFRNNKILYNNEKR